MRYLATVGQKPLWGPQKLQLHCKEIDKYTWVRVKAEISLETTHKFQPSMLVIAHITTVNNRLQRLDEPTDSLIATLHDFTHISRRYKELANDIEVWKESMQYQLEELRRREEDLMLRAQELQLDLTCALDQPRAQPSIPVSLLHQSELYQSELSV